MCASYSQKSRKSHFDSFANKILTGIKEIVPDYAERRAIWELFQNALDIVEDKNGKLSIKVSPNGFIFEHNGKPFHDDNLGALVKQYSNGKDYGSNKTQTGQYGTGFLSTHVYGRQIILNGSVQVDDLSYRLLEDFKMDRSANDVEVLSQSLINQDDAIELLCDQGTPLSTKPRETTSFEYIASPANKLSIKVMTEYLQGILPYVFCFNEKLDEVIIQVEQTTTRYKREAGKENTLILKKNDDEIRLEFLADEENNIRIVFPQKGLDFSQVPKLFLFYPLMETAGNGLNFLVHAQEFRPNRERDYLHLVAKNDDLVADVSSNKKLLEKAYSLIIDKIVSDESLDFLSALNIEFVADEDEFEVTMKKDYIEKVRPLERIVVGTSTNAIGAITFFDEEVLALPVELLRSFYKVFSQFKALPAFEDYLFLSKIACNWRAAEVSDLSIFGLKEIFACISESTAADYNQIIQQQDYLEMIRCIENDVELLNEFPLIPNMHHELKTFSELVRWEEKEPHFIQVVDALNADISEHYVLEDYGFISNLKSYNRVDFRDEFNKSCTELTEKLSKSGETFATDDCRFFNLSHYLCFFIGLNGTTPINGALTAFFKAEFELDFRQEFIGSPTVDTNFLPAIKLLCRLYIRRLQAADAEHIEAKTEKLLELITLINPNTQLKDDLLDKLACFPNQKFSLKSQSELKIDAIADEVFKNKYQQITGIESREVLALRSFNDFLQHKDTLSGLQLGEEMERTLHPSKVFMPVQVETLPTVLELIKNISINPATWGSWLPNIDRVKEEILMHKFQDKNTRTSLFNILSEDEEKINLLGELALIEDLQGLVDAGKEKLKEKHRHDQHLDYIKEIGIRIQDMIQKQIDESLKDTFALVDSTKDKKLQTQEQQNGQDFIIYRGTQPIYFIEVKSRWDKDGIVALSKRQVECCARNPEKYAVITVNVADYKSRVNVNVDDISFDKLYEDIYINDDLSEEFEQLIKENRTLEMAPESGKLIEFRGHIPQDRIRSTGISFDDFIANLKTQLSTLANIPFLAEEAATTESKGAVS